MLVLSRSETETALEPERVLTAVAAALVAISRDEVSAPSRIAARAPDGILGTMPAYVPGLGLAAKLVSVFAAPGPAGRSTHRGVAVVFDEHDGRPLAVMDAEPVTAVRTAAVATVSMSALARPNPQRIAILGNGVQARAQAAMLTAIGANSSVVIGGRDQQRAETVAACYPGAAADSIEAAVKGADVVFCCTGARQPVIQRAWLADGAHVSSVGGSEGAELDAATVSGGSLFVEWGGAVTSRPPAGAHELQGLPPERATLLGAVLDGSHPGRRDPSELTVFKSTGHAALDVAAASVVYEFARTHGTGSTVDM